MEISPERLKLSSEYYVQSDVAGEYPMVYQVANSAGDVQKLPVTVEIYDIVWKESYSGDYNIIMSHIRNIREKIEDNPSKPIYIQTVWGVGYRFNKNLTG